MRRPDAGGATVELDALVEEWTADSSAARDRFVDLLRTAHMVLGPVVVLAAVLIQPGGAVTIAGIVYLLGLLAVLGAVRRTSQLGLIALFDVLLVSFVAGTDPVMWHALLVPLVAATTVGWLAGPRVTWGLWFTAAAGFGAAGLIVEPQAFWLVYPVFVATTLGMHRTNLEIIGHGRESVLRVTDLVDSLPVIVWEGDGRSGEIRRALGWVEDLTGYDPTEWRLLPIGRRVKHDDLAGYLARTEEALDSGAPVVHEYRLRCADGSELNVREVVRRVDVGDDARLRGVILDIGDEAAARETVERLATVIERQPQPLLVLEPRTDDDVVVVEANPAFRRLAGGDLVPGATRLAALDWLPRMVLADLVDHWATGRLVDRDEVEITSPTSSRIYDYTIVALPDGSTAVQFSDVTERRAATDLIRHQAFHDPLTGLPNRTLLFDRVSQALSGLGRAESSLGLLLLDLDQFKEINDTLGHAYGDELLSTIGDRLSAMTRDSDTVARLGGDEFAMVAVGASASELEEIALRVHEAVRRPIALGGIDVEVSASIGGTLAPLHGDDAHTLLQRADVAMYDAKRAGNPYHLYVPDDDRHSLDRLTLMGELRNLLDGELRVWFQPKVDLRTGRARDVEALARWEHPRLGLLSPGQFIELCELSGTIGDLTFRVLEQSIETMVQWPDVRVAVNVPVRNLYDRALPEFVFETLEANEVAPERLILEITEREIMEDHRAIFDVLGALDERGVKLSIDDFGTGFSSLTHLRRLPISEIKIDQSFVAGMLDRENDYIIARSIIDLAHNLGHRVVAEGVEDSATMQLLAGLGCDVAQGFLFSRPGPMTRIRTLMESGPALRDGSVAWAPSV